MAEHRSIACLPADVYPKHLGATNSPRLYPSSLVVVNPARRRPPKMSMFRAKKLDLGCFVKARTIRDHTKRKVFEEFETERCAPPPPLSRLGRIATIASVLGMTMLTWKQQTSAAVHHPKHDSHAPSARRSPAAADADALLHPPDADPEPLHHGRPGPRCPERLQNVKSEDVQVGLRCLVADGGQFNFRMQAMAGNLPGVKRASW
ncbi:37S ribosomal protein MRP2, mitochondrial [Tolypocladium capitatum]|uniref:37S ribosomal protein MRP2, mitochondrial n=1 Tax=Tolypocladium capitatum TaxID=45235 RepID=A0A2K3Q889_9HYPO|nr:37S ribosomal protein MRP2, mitochondrial [Tolypocladium capitatum]